MKEKSVSIKECKIGTKINYLTILKFTKTNTPKKVLCRCDCGKEKELYLSNIIPKPNCRYTLSCGCKRGSIVGEKVSTHKMSKTKFYKRWRSMFDRISPKYICAKDYVGIKVCKRWSKFENFLDDMLGDYCVHAALWGERQTTLDRINPFKDYSKKNCRWATFSEQNLNTKRQWLQKYKEIVE